MVIIKTDSQKGRMYMGSFYKKALGFGALGAAAGAVAYYLKKQKEKDR